MKTRIITSLIAISFAFVGCYTSFAQREYEEESYGQIEEAVQPDSMIIFEDENGRLDTVYIYSENNNKITDEQPQNITVVNNYYDDNYADYGCWFGGFYGFPRFYYPSSVYFCDPYWYDPFYCDYYYYRPYYGVYFGVSYYYDSYYRDYYYYPSPERYRYRTSHWTSLRNNDGGRGVGRKSRDAYRDLYAANRVSSSPMEKGINSEREIVRTSDFQRKTQLASVSNGGIRKSNSEISRKTSKEVKQAGKITSNSDNNRVYRKIVSREAVDQTKPKRTSRTYSSTKKDNSRKRTYSNVQRRTYDKTKSSSSQNMNNSQQSSSSSKSYYRSGERKSSRSYKNQTNSSSRPEYKSNSSRSSNSSSYSGNKSSSRSSRSSYSGSSSRSSSRSSYSSGSSSRSSSRSSYTGSSSRSSSRSSASRSSSTRSSSSRSSGKRR